VRSTRAVYTPSDALLAAALLFSVLPAAPLTSTLTRLVGVPLQGPLVALWFVGLLVVKRHGRGLAFALLMIVVGGWSALFGGDPMIMRTWLGTVVVPLLLFAGIQALREHEIAFARDAIRLVLFVTVALQVFFYVEQAGIPSIFSPGFVLGHHTDVAFWKQVGGQVLANPTNASVIFCAAFAWAVAERALGNPGRFSWSFVLFSVLAVWVTGSRGAYLTAGLVVQAAALFHARSRKRLAFTALAAVAVYAAGSYWLSHFATRAHTAESLNARLETRRAAIPEVIGHPVGHGPGKTADVLHNTFGNVVFLGIDTNGATSHDLFLNWGVCVGWIGLGLLLFALGLGLIRGWKGGPLGVLPLLAFLLSGESTGIDVLSASNAAWSVVMWVLIGLAWKGGIVSEYVTYPSGVAGSAEETQSRYLSPLRSRNAFDVAVAHQR